MSACMLVALGAVNGSGVMLFGKYLVPSTEADVGEVACAAWSMRAAGAGAGNEVDSCSSSLIPLLV